MRTPKLLTLIGIAVILMATPVRADITPALMQEWGRQPNNVQWNVFYQNTNIQVVDKLPWESPDLASTWAYTTMNVIPGTTYVSSIDMYIKRGYETALTHEVGHAISNANHSLYWWCIQPSFIQIWQQERYNNVMMAQGFDNILEYFACAYDLYINYPQLLKQTNPLTWNYLQVVMQYT